MHIMDVRRALRPCSWRDAAPKKVLEIMVGNEWINSSGKLYIVATILEKMTSAKACKHAVMPVRPQCHNHV